jgi:hypothetical protein
MFIINLFLLLLLSLVPILLFKYQRKTFYSFLIGITLIPIIFAHLQLNTGGKAIDEFNNSGLIGLFFLSPLLIIAGLYYTLWPVILFFIYEIKHKPTSPINWKKYINITITYIALSLLFLGIRIGVSPMYPDSFWLNILPPNIITTFICLILGFIAYKKIKNKELNFYPFFVITTSLLIIHTIISDLYISYIMLSIR